MKKLFVLMFAAMAFVACDDIFDLDYMSPDQIDSEALMEDLCSGVLSVKDFDSGNIVLLIDGKWQSYPTNQIGIGYPEYLFYADGSCWSCMDAPPSHITVRWEYDSETATLHTFNWTGEGVRRSLRVASYNAQTGEIDLEGDIWWYFVFGSTAIRMRCELRAQDRNLMIRRYSKPHPDYDYTSKEE